MTDYCVILALVAALVLLMVGGVTGHIGDMGDVLTALLISARTSQ